MTKEQYEAVEQLGQQIFETLEEAVKTSDPAGELGQRTAALHREWLCFYWDSYSKEAHARLANMYVADERYTAYYDKIQPGATAFLRDAIRIYTHSIQE